MAVQSPHYVIRRAKPSDIRSLIRLLKLLFSIESDFSFNELTQQRGLEMMLQNTGDRCVMVAESQQQIIGMCTAQTLVSTAEGGIAAIIEDLIVEEIWRGQGLGKKLLSAVEEWAITRGVNRLQLLADRNNTAAIGFYNNVNWQRTDLICLRKYVSISE
ncbi:acetyltransferase [Desulfosporosinus acidiphilus SJ4]|uniref:Acetyltransferase n=1 Tax=Desulfosporosinus acidiphilus (strain DSM 22704 / JCM 16185 / SJ4) TaxID=646529 RepID=I4DAR8_DESAJ|nr:GNAT family N-acetyltransferase [Desulfosporosinus acidiphilus]AFM42892.1 acetyltransferase [Desulfosporosinus acidiphilus SJ4]